MTCWKKHELVALKTQISALLLPSWKCNANQKQTKRHPIENGFALFADDTKVVHGGWLLVLYVPTASLYC